MLKRSALFVAAATAVLGLAVFTSSEADAGRRGNPGGGAHSHGRGHVHVPHFHRPHIHRHIRIHIWRHHWHPRRIVLYRPYVTPVHRPVAGPCTCLRKTYLPNGAVLFQDVCTQESAMNPPAPPAAS